MTGSQRSSISNMEIQEPLEKKKGLFQGDSKRTFMIIAGIFAVLAVLTLVIVLPVYFTVIEPGKEEENPPTEEPIVTEPTQTVETTTIPILEAERVDCYPDNSSASKQDCGDRGCTWSPNPDNPSAPACVYAGTRAYMTEGETEDTPQAITSVLVTSSTRSRGPRSATRAAPNHFGELFPKLIVTSTFISSTTLRVKIAPEEKRYEVPLDHPPTVDRPSDALYSVDHVNEGGKFGVKVQRKSESRLIFDTSVGEMMFADQFLQISTRVASEYIYGFGEHMHESFKHDMNWKTYGMFSRDQGVGPNVNLYGVHPYFLCMEGDGNAYGVYFVNSNAMDVTLQPAPAITYRSIGGLMDFYIFLGPSPEQVTEQYTAIIGRPYFPPYWSLGFQLCRYDYENLDNLTKVVNRNLGKIPYEIQYSDIDYMERQLDFTIDNKSYFGLEDFVTNLKEDHKMRYIIILDPAISGNETESYPPFENGDRDDVFIKTPEGEIAWGKVWPDYPHVVVDESQEWDYQTENYRAFAAFPDFNSESTAEWWKNLTVHFHDRIPFDGLWIDMNEPASFVHGSPTGCPEDSMLDNPPYVPHLASGNIYDKTLCMRNKQRHPSTGEDTDHYNVHSLYGKSQGLPTVEACRASTGERCMVISRSTYPGSGKHVGHWLGDNASIWEHLRTSIIGIMEFNLFGIPYIGADVCGFFQDATESLCQRWMQVGAFYPFDRNHNGKGWAEQDPGYFGEQFLADSKKVLDVRYTLLPYLYTLFYEAQNTGATVVRPMMNQFPSDTNTYTAEGQFMWGPGLLITPVLTEATTSVEGYFPSGRWFDYYTGVEMPETGKNLTLDAPLDHINLHLYGGNIIPTQEPALTTFYSRQNPFGLIVVLDENEKSSGKLFWDDGTSIDTVVNMEYTLIEFNCQSNTLSSDVIYTNTTSEDMMLGTIRVLGVSDVTSQVMVDGTEHTDFTYNLATKELQIKGLMLDLKEKFSISWIPSIVLESERVDCYPDNATATEEQCWERGCSWAPGANPDAPNCFFAGQRGYVAEDNPTVNNGGISSTLMATNNAQDHFGTLYNKLTVETTYVSGTTVRVKIYPDEERYEVPMDHPANIDIPSDALYQVDHVSSDGKFGVKVQRKSGARTIFDTSVGEMMFADQFLQISTRVASEYIYGFGEHMHESFKHDMNWKTYGMFSRDQGVGPNVNLYGVHPYFLCMEGDGNAYGVYFVNSNAMDVTLQPAPAITYRSIGGLMDFYIFLGPSPEKVTEQYTAVIGRPYFPPYWSLGFQLCRYDYENLDNLTKVVNRNLGQIPYEIQYSDIDYMERQLDFTIDNESYYGLEDFVRNLKEDHKMRYIIILDPAISGNETESYPPYENGIRDDVFIKTPEGGIAWGKVWPDYPKVFVDESQDWDYQTENYRAFAAFPDFNLNSTAEWWKNLTVEFHDRIPFDGLWIDMNEPASFVHGSPTGCPEDSLLDNPPYVPHLASGNIYDKTLCMRSKQRHPSTGEDTDHYNVHSLYGRSQGLPTVEACRASTGERCMVISRSTYPGSGKHVGHWLGDNASIWGHLKTSIIGIMEFNLFGIPYIGADVCGFFQDTTESLCQRWMQVGAFYPFDRNHNGKGWAEQDPGYFGEQFLADSKKVLDVRYTLLPYLYTLFYEAQDTGATVVRPMMNQFPSDVNTYTAEEQFMWGSGLLITPVLTEATTQVTGYFPNGRWFDYYTGEEMADTGKDVTLNAPLDHINLHLYGGNVLPTQEPALTTYYSRQNPFGLIVVLDENGNSNGKLFWDDGTSIDTIANMEYTLIEFNCEKSTLSSQIIHTNKNETMILGSIRIMGVTEPVTRITVDGNNHDNFTQDGTTKEIFVQELALDLTERFEIRWEENDEWKRVDCMPSRSAEPTEGDCITRACVWDASADGMTSPKCYYGDGDIPSYSATTTRVSSNSYIFTRKTGTDQRYGTPVETLQLDIEYQTDHRLHFKIKDNTSIEIPAELNNFPTTTESDDTMADYTVEVMTDPFSVRVARKSTNKTLFDTSVGPLVYEEKYREISTSLPSDLVFGLGEHNHRRYRHDLNWKRWAIFTRDVAPVDEWNLYGHQTFYMAVDDTNDGTAVGVYLHNSNAMDVFLTPDPKLTYRTVGGVLDFYIFVGDTQEDVVQQYHNFIGLPMMPPYWGLGFQLSRWGYESLAEVQGIVNDMRDAQIPFDIQYGDIDYMERYKSFTYDKTSWSELPAFVDDLHSWGMKYVIILDPGILIEPGYKAFDDGIIDDIYIKSPDGSKPVTTEVWPGETYHPDYTHPNATSWWTNQCRDFFEDQGVKYDALWVDMNEPANFQPDDPVKFANMNCSDEYNKPPYMPHILWYGNGLHDKTMCMENQQYMGLHYDLHSLYGHTMSISTYEALQSIMPDKRSFVITRSTFTGTGKYAGHWLGDNQSQWRQMAWPIPAMFEFNLFGFPYIGADVCGFWYNTTEEMCQRWMQVGAFYPFSRNHNAATMIPQHPTAFGEEFIASSKDVLEIRYSILPYMYTLHYQASTFGGTVVRALVHEFPQDKNTWDADRQFMLGSGFLITPVLDEGVTKVTGYFPGDARWYDFRTGRELRPSGRFVSLDAPMEYINLHVKGGTIIPRQNPAVTTVQSRQNPMSLIVALDEAESASGLLYWDDGEARNVGENYTLIRFNFTTDTNLTLRIEVEHPAEGIDMSTLHFESITIYGLPRPTDAGLVTVVADGESTGTSVNNDYNALWSVLYITELDLDLSKNYTIIWLPA